MSVRVGLVDQQIKSLLTGNKLDPQVKSYDFDQQLLSQKEIIDIESQDRSEMKISKARSTDQKIDEQIQRKCTSDGILQLKVFARISKF